MYESPIEKVVKEVMKQDEEHLMYSVEQTIGYAIDKEELIKALQYDRNQYEKGYEDGLKDGEETMPLVCLKCKKPIPLSMRTFKEVSYTHYSYCENCLRKGLKALSIIEKVKEDILETETRLYAKVYANSDPSEIAEKIYCIANGKLDEVIEELQEYRYGEDSE